MTDVHMEKEQSPQPGDLPGVRRVPRALCGTQAQTRYITHLKSAVTCKDCKRLLSK